MSKSILVTALALLFFIISLFSTLQDYKALKQSEARLNHISNIMKVFVDTYQTGE